jgi:hypothetical protein
MPRVPSYDDFQVAPQVAPAARAETAVTPQMMSVSGEQLQGVGRGLQAVGDAGSKIMMDVQKDINEAATREADNQFTKAANGVVSNYLTQSGKAAVVSQSDVEKAITDAANNAGEGLKNDMQRRMYSEVASRRVQGALGQITMHAATQAKQWNITATKARTTNASDSMASNWYQWKDDFSDLRVDPSSVDKSTWAKRPDGSEKSMGYLGPLKNANGSISTELSIGVKIKGKEMDIPTLVPTLTRQEVNTVLNLKEGEKMPESIVQKAVEHAQMRIADGKSPFADDKDGPKQQSNRYTQDKNTLIAEVDNLVYLETGGDPSSDIGKAMRRSYLTGAHANVIQKMIVGGESMKARDYLQSAERSGEIEPDKSKPLYDLVKGAGVADEALKLSMSLKGGIEAKQTQLDNLFKEQKISAEVYKEARGNIEHNWTMQKARQAEYEKTVIGNSTDWFNENKGSSILDFKRAQPVLYQQLQNSGHLSGITSFARSNKVDTDPVVWANVLTNQQELKAMTPNEIFNKYRFSLDDQHLEKAYAINAALNGSKDEQHLSIMSTSDMVKDSAVRLGVLPATGKANDTQAKGFNDFQLAIDAKVAAYENGELGGKRKASQQELKKILQEVEMDKVYKSRTGWFDKADVPVASMKPEDLQHAYVKVGDEEISLAAIPANQRALIIPALRSAGKPITEQNIANYWVRGGKKK